MSSQVRKRAVYQDCRPRVNKQVYRYFSTLAQMVGYNGIFVLNYLMAKWIKAVEANQDYEDIVRQVAEDVAGYEEFVEADGDMRAIGAQFLEDLAPVIEGLLDPWKENHGQE